MRRKYEARGDSGGRGWDDVGGVCDRGVNCRGGDSVVVVVDFMAVFVVVVVLVRSAVFGEGEIRKGESATDLWSEWLL